MVKNSMVNRCRWLEKSGVLAFFFEVGAWLRSVILSSCHLVFVHGYCSCSFYNPTGSMIFALYCALTVLFITLSSGTRSNTGVRGVWHVEDEQHPRMMWISLFHRVTGSLIKTLKENRSHCSSVKEGKIRMISAYNFSIYFTNDLICFSGACYSRHKEIRRGWKWNHVCIMKTTLFISACLFFFFFFTAVSSCYILLSRNDGEIFSPQSGYKMIGLMSRGQDAFRQISITVSCLLPNCMLIIMTSKAAEILTHAKNSILRRRKCNYLVWFTTTWIECCATEWIRLNLKGTYHSKT